MAHINTVHRFTRETVVVTKRHVSAIRRKPYGKLIPVTVQYYARIDAHIGYQCIIRERVTRCVISEMQG